MDVIRTLRGFVLVAEDNPVNREVVRAMLSSWGLEVACVATGREAVDAFLRRRPDAVLMDVQMPDLDGLQATAGIRDIERAKGWPRTAVIALTGTERNMERERCLAAGMDDFLGKPFTRERLAQVLARYLACGEAFGRRAASGVAQALEGLRDLEETSPGLIRNIARIFLDSTPSLVDAMRRAQPDTRDAVERAAHSLKSSSARMGATEVSALAALAEVAAKNNALAVVRDHGERIAQLLEPVYRELRRHVEAIEAGRGVQPENQRIAPKH